MLSLIDMTDTKNDGVFLFYSSKSPFSNFYPASFSITDKDGTKYEYNCSEQRFMHVKALTFGDAETAKKIMKSSNPGMQKKLGRAVKEFDEKTWERTREAVMFEAVLAKFSQNKELREALLGVKGRFAEASPGDRVWGIGLSSSNPDAKNPDKWPGENLLGRILDRVRDTLAKS
ncbi:MAG: NADAR family protein [Patescibacteria group bacterium]|nr:NADAR family protein [Patescibacteria group bacterium]